MNFYKAAQSKTWIKFFDINYHEAATGQHERSKTAVFVLYVPQAEACWRGSENEMRSGLNFTSPQPDKRALLFTIFSLKSFFKMLCAHTLK